MNIITTFKRGDKVNYTTELAFGKGKHTEQVTIVAVRGRKLLLDNGAEVNI